MLSELLLENFKSFGKETRLPLAPVTLLFGPNSSGKSSVLQSILMLKQTLQEAPQREVTCLPNGKLVDLGDYLQMAHKQELHAYPSVGFRWASSPMVWSGLLDLDSAINVKSPWCKLSFGLNLKEVVLTDFLIGTDDFTSELVGFELADDQSQYEERDIRNARAPFFPATFFNTEHPSLQQLWDAFKEDLPQRITAWEEYAKTDGDEGGSRDILAALSASTYESFVQALVQYHKSVVMGFHHFTPESFETPDGVATLHVAELIYRTLLRRGEFEESSRDNSVFNGPTRLAIRIGRLLRSQLESTRYIGPLRDMPPRFFTYIANARDDVGVRGESFGHVVVDQIDSLCSDDAEFLQQLNRWMERLRLGYRIRIKNVHSMGEGGLYSVELEDTDTGARCAVRDVGMGISQVLPILVQSLIGNNQLTLIEQPELHLHPKAQAEFGSLLAECSEPFGSLCSNQFIVETHSEHIVLRLQRLVREGKLRPQHVSILYFTKDGAGTSVHPIRIDDEGDFLDEWPDGFFPERLNELR